MTSIEWLKDYMQKMQYFIGNDLLEAFEEAKEMHKQEIVEAYCNGNDLIGAEEYYQETFVSKVKIKFTEEEWAELNNGSNGSDECYFEPKTNTSSATICKHCGREKFLHTT
jgi:hypothetical protein